MERKLKDILRKSSLRRRGPNETPPSQQSTANQAPLSQRTSYEDARSQQSAPQESAAESMTHPVNNSPETNTPAYRHKRASLEIPRKPITPGVAYGAGSHQSNSANRMSSGSMKRPAAKEILVDTVEGQPTGNEHMEESIVDTGSSRYNEDVADRNIDRWGSGKTSSARNSMDTDLQPHHEAHVRWRGQRNSERLSGNNALGTQNHGSSIAHGPYDRQEVEAEKERLSKDPALKGIVDLTDTVDVDKTTTWAPAVTHETVNHYEHEIRQEVIYREIHNHDVYHSIQPVLETEILPARHFIPKPDGKGLIEVPASHFPDSTADNQRWFIGAKEPKTSNDPMSYTKLTSPRLIDEKTYITPEGYERKESTWLHPPTLEDIAIYAGRVRPIHFGENGLIEDGPEVEKKRDYIPTADPMAMKELTKALPNVDGPVPEKLIPPRTSSLRNKSRRNSLRQEANNHR